MYPLQKRIQFVLVPIFLVLLVLILHSCGKDEDPQFQEYSCNSDCYSIEGYVLQGQDSTPLTGAILEFTKRYNQFNTDLLASKTSDVNGYFKFEIPVSYFADITDFVGVDVSKEGIVYSPHHDLVHFDSTDVGVVKRRDYLLYTASALSVIVHNNPDTDFGSLDVSCIFNLDAIPDIGSVIIDNTTTDRKVDFKVPADMPTVVSWHTYDGEIEVDGETTITVPRDSTHTIDIYL